MGRAFNLNVGLALGGGAARGLAHLGVLRVLEREKIPIHTVVGTSMGAIIGGAWVAIGDAAALEAAVRAVLTSEEFQKNRLSFLKETKNERGGLFFSVANLVRKGIFFGVSNLRGSFLSAEAFAGSMAAIIPEGNIEDLPLPFGAVALDVDRAEEVLLRRGSLRRASAASSAIPGILPPVPLNGSRLIDGGWVDKIPVLPTFKMGADVVIGIDISADLDSVQGYHRGVDLMVRANAIKDAALVGFSRRLADVVIEPRVKDVHWADFGSYEICIAEGEKATERAIPEIRALLRQERLLSLVRSGTRKRMAAQHIKNGLVIREE